MKPEMWIMVDVSKCSIDLCFHVTKESIIKVSSKERVPSSSYPVNLVFIFLVLIIWICELVNIQRLDYIGRIFNVSLPNSKWIFKFIYTLWFILGIDVSLDGAAHRLCLLSPKNTFVKKPIVWAPLEPQILFYNAWLVAFPSMIFEQKESNTPSGNYICVFWGCLWHCQ